MDTLVHYTIAAIKWLIEFLVLTVGLKMIVGHWVAEKAVAVLPQLWRKNERKLAIFEHYVVKDHRESIFKCKNDRCAIL
jgi:hypothetical protein